MTRKTHGFFLLASVGLTALLLTPLVISAQKGKVDDEHDCEDIPESTILRGLEIAPVPLNHHHKNRALVGLGSYIVNAQADCNGCHTVNFDPYLPGGNPFFGEPEKIDPDKYLVGGSNFFDDVTSRNLRPDAQGRPAGLTFEEFKLVLRTGIDLDHAHPQFGPLLQVMPWPTFGKMKRRDIRAIYEYLSALPPHAGFPE